MNFRVDTALVKNKYSEVVKATPISLSKLSTNLSSIREGEKDGIAWLPGDIEIGPRKKERVRSISALVLDIEAKKCEGAKEPPQPEAMVGRLQRSGLAAIIHTTYSHSKEHPRYRIVIPFAKPIPPTEIRGLGLEVILLLKIDHCTDTACLEPARLFYLPRCPKGKKELFEHYQVGGELLNTDEIQLKIDKKNLNTISSLDNTTRLLIHLPEETPHAVARLKNQLNYISADCAYEIYRNIIWAIIGTDLECAEQLAREWSQTAPERWNEDVFNTLVASYDRTRKDAPTLRSIRFHAREGGWNG